MGANKVSKIGSLGVVAWPLVVGALVLASCGSDTTAGSTASTINLDATNYIVKEPVTTTIAPAVEEGGTTDQSQVYTVQSGDYPLIVAERFGVPLDALLNINGWASGNEFPFPGEEIRIPPGGITPTAEASTDAGGSTDTVVGATIPEAGSNCAPGSYVIESGDFEGRVADKFDVTVDALRAANAGTADYSIFYVGLKIVIPAKSDC